MVYLSGKKKLNLLNKHERKGSLNAIYLLLLTKQAFISVND